MKHIEFEKLVDKFESGNAVHLTDDVAEHLGECTTCSSEFRRLAEFFAYVSPDGLEDVPQATTARILNIYNRRPIAETQSIKRASGLGFLVFDDWATALNERYSGIDSRQMLYRVDGYDVDLRIEFVANKCHLAGQVLPGIGNAAITLASQDISVHTRLNEFGEFEFEPVEPGIYSLKISSDDESLMIEEVPLHH